MLELSYFLLSATLVVIASVMYYKSANRIGKNGSTGAKLIVFGSILWVIYLYVLEQSGVLLDRSMPPKVPLLVVLPFVLFTILIYRKNRTNSVLQAMPKSWLVYIQSFRIFVEIIILFTFLKGIIPQSATFEGYNFDIVMGGIAPFVGFFLFRNGVKICYWLVFGMYSESQ